MDAILQTSAKKKTKWMEDLYFAVKFADQKLSKYYTEVTPTTGLLVISADIPDPFRKLRSFRKWVKGMDTTPEDETFYTAQYQESYMQYVENKYRAKKQRLPDVKPGSVPNNPLLSSAMSSRSVQSFYDQYDSSSDYAEYLMPKDVAEMTRGRCDRAVCLVTAVRLHLNSPPGLPQNAGQINPNLNDHHSNPMEICSTFRILAITDWWYQQEETHSMYANLPNVAGDILSIILHDHGVESCFRCGQDVICCRLTKTTGGTLQKKVVVRQCAWANNGILASDDLVLDTSKTENDLEMKREAEEMKMHRMAKVQDFL